MDAISAGASRLELALGDITTESVDAIVNAANSRLVGGGGVDGAIHHAGGPSIMKECRKIGGCPTGQAVVTGAGRLKVKWVIHTVGPVYSGRPQDAQLLASAYRESLKRAVEIGATSVAFPSISTGVYGYPLEEAAPIAIKTVQDFLEENKSIQRVRFVLFSEEALAVYQRALRA